MSKMLGAGILLLGMSLQLGATTLAYKGFNDLVKESDGIVSGRVAKIESQYNKEKDIYTFVTLDQLNVLGGSYNGATLTLRFHGGKVENDILQVEGSPEFEVNQNVVLFVQGNGRAMAPVVGWTQGVFRLVKDSKTGQQVVNDHEGNLVTAVQGGMVIKEMVNQPEAQIVGGPAIARAATDNKTNAGSADYGSSRSLDSADVAGSVGSSLIGGTVKAMTSMAFLNVVKSAASSKAAAQPLVSVTTVEASASSEDGSIGPKTAAPAPVQQAPALPKLTQEAPANDQR